MAVSLTADIDRRKIVDFKAEERGGKRLKKGGSDKRPSQTMEAAGFNALAHPGRDAPKRLAELCTTRTGKSVV
jgi:hypothetical protein